MALLPPLTHPPAMDEGHTSTGKSEFSALRIGANRWISASGWVCSSKSLRPVFSRCASTGPRVFRPLADGRDGSRCCGANSSTRRPVAKAGFQNAVRVWDAVGHRPTPILNDNLHSPQSLSRVENRNERFSVAAGNVRCRRFSKCLFQPSAYPTPRTVLIGSPLP